jgi:hypothetical protein
VQEFLILRRTSPPQVAQLVGAIKGRISGGAIVMDAGSDLALNIKLNLTEESAAGEANQALTGLVMMGKQMAPFASGPGASTTAAFSWPGGE